MTEKLNILIYFKMKKKNIKFRYTIIIHRKCTLILIICNSEY